MKIILIDIDGVLTDGRITIDENGNETKSICYRDLDAIGVGRSNGYDFAFVTGEDTPMVATLAKRFNISIVYTGTKDKLAAMELIAAEHGVYVGELLFIGDSDRDAPALEAVGLGIAPHDASEKARVAASIVAETKGGRGVLLEVIDKLIAGKWYHPNKSN